MNWVLFVFLLFALQLYCVVVASRAAKGQKSNRDYFLAGKTVRFFPLMMTLVATQIGGGLVLGAAQEAYTYGWSVILYPLGQSLGFILLAMGIGRKMAESGASTVAELCEKAFGSRKLRQVASVLSMVSLFMIFVAQVIASKKFMISLGLESNLLFLSFWGLLIVYTVIGGLKGVIATDIVQAVFFIVVFIIAFLIADGSQIFGLIESTGQAVFEADPTSKMLGWLVMPLLFMAIEQDMGQRCFAADSPKTVTAAAFASAFITIVICAIPVYFGVLARSMNIEVAEGGSVFMTVIQSVTNPYVTAFIACAVIAAIISTAESLINSISSNLTQDFRWETSQSKSTIRIARLFTSAIAVAGLLVSFYFNNIVDVLIQSYDLSLSCLFVPVMVALVRGKGSAKAAWLSFAVGAIAYIIFKIIPYEVPRELLSILFSAIGYWVGSKMFKS